MVLVKIVLIDVDATYISILIGPCWKARGKDLEFHFLAFIQTAFVGFGLHGSVDDGEGGAGQPLSL